jgi:hypothetical protein
METEKMQTLAMMMMMMMMMMMIMVVVVVPGEHNKLHIVVESPKIELYLTMTIEKERNFDGRGCGRNGCCCMGKRCCRYSTSHNDDEVDDSEEDDDDDDDGLHYYEYQSSPFYEKNYHHHHHHHHHHHECIDPPCDIDPTLSIVEPSMGALLVRSSGESKQ